mgnify:CR=1 FL=1
MEKQALVVQEQQWYQKSASPLVLNCKREMNKI